jgi:excisionase family DNA binding protein
MASTDVKMTVPEAARRLGVDGGEVYRLIFRGALSARPGTDGAVYVVATSVDEYLRDPEKDSRSHS